MKNYLELLKKIKEEGIKREDRTGVGTLSIVAPQLRFDLSQGFPALTTKKLYFTGALAELLWFLKGDTNVKFLHDHGVHFWDSWADESGSVGLLYGHQWRNWNSEGHDQVANLIDQIKKDPYSRRHVMSSWNVSQLKDMNLHPCHPFEMFYVADNKLTCHFVMRSTDVMVGLPVNIACYALLTHMIAQVCGLGVGELIYTGNDAHIYTNHLEQVDKQLSRKPFPLPILWLNPEVKSIDDFTMGDAKLINYQSHPPIKLPVAV